MIRRNEQINLFDTAIFGISCFDSLLYNQGFRKKYRSLFNPNSNFSGEYNTVQKFKLEWWRKEVCRELRGKIL